jgi:FMN reductase
VSFTAENIRILGIGGDMSENSTSRIALQAALRIAEASGATTVLADVRDLDLPFYNPEWTTENFPNRLTDLLDEVRRADAYIICSPDYHFTVSGAVKNVLDVFSLLDPPNYLAGKPVGLMATGVAVGNVITALDHAVHALNGLAVPTFAGIPTPFIDAATEDVAPGPQRERLQQMIDEVVDLARRLRPSELPVRS